MQLNYGHSQGATRRQHTQLTAVCTKKTTRARIVVPRHAFDPYVGPRSIFPDATYVAE
jgi:hypothetical protein